MKGSTGVSMGGTIEYTRKKKKKKKGKTCVKCGNFRRGYCTEFGFRPSDLSLAQNCKSLISKQKSKNNTEKKENGVQ